MTPAKTNQNPPDTLGKAGKKFWKSVMDDYELADGHHLKLLESACLCLDRASAARSAIEEGGIVTKNRFGELREHPAVGTERSSLSLFRQTVRELGLDLDGGPVEVRGPRRAGTRS